MDLQKLIYFAEGNTFTGEANKDRERGLLVRYKVVPDKENGVLKAQAWFEDLCCSKAKDILDKEFLLTQEGLDQLRAWLQELYDGLGKK